MKMNEPFFDLTDKKQIAEGIGIPIPRAQQHMLHRPDYFLYQGQLEHECSSPSLPPNVPPNSLVTNTPGSHFDHQTFSEYHPISPEMLYNHNFDDLEVKIEPMEEYSELPSLNTNQGYGIGSFPDDKFLDDVNLEDLLCADEMESTPTCLDPQHSSPAAMATVHPDEVFGMHISNRSSLFSNATPSFSAPIKTENTSNEVNAASSFPPQGIGWKDPFIAGSNSYSFSNFNKGSSHQVQFSQPVPSPVFTEADQSIQYRESFSPLENSSALHDLLVNSPSTSASIGASPQSNLSPSPQLLSPQIPIGQSVPGPSNLLASNSILSSRLSSSAPTSNFSLDKMWQRREARHMLSSGSLAEEYGGSASSLSTCGILSPTTHDPIEDDGETDDDSDDDSDSDIDSIRSEDTGSYGTRKERHFWQYNVQAKGPKGQRVNITRSETDPHKLQQIMDPVFSPAFSVQGIKHSGKARRGDGNDLTPCPRKLVAIGNELEKLNKKITEMTPVSELPNNIRSKSRKEKNKLASRACRLKKKAQHEANKIKLHGLEQEHKAMMAILHKCHSDLLQKVSVSQSESPQFDQPKTQLNLTNQIDRTLRQGSKNRIAGQTAEFVNRVIDNCRSGNPTGGLDQLLQFFLKTNICEDQQSPEGILT